MIKLGMEVNRLCVMAKKELSETGEFNLGRLVESLRRSQSASRSTSHKMEHWVPITDEFSELYELALCRLEVEVGPLVCAPANDFPDDRTWGYAGVLRSSHFEGKRASKSAIGSRRRRALNAGHPDQFFYAYDDSVPTHCWRKRQESWQK